MNGKVYNNLNELSPNDLNGTANAESLHVGSKLLLELQGKFPCLVILGLLL